MRIFVAAVLALLGLMGCAEPERDYIIGDERFTQAEREAILEGVAFIEAKTGRTLPEIRWEPLPDRLVDVIVKQPLAKDILGQCPVGFPRLKLDIQHIDEYQTGLRVVVAHELGHWFGLEHIDAPGLMSPWASRSDELIWTDADQASCEALGVCQAATSGNP